MDKYVDSPDARPLIYIDQNVIDEIRKGRLTELIDLFLSTHRAAYSDETLKEIQRAVDGGGDANNYLDGLVTIDAFHIKQSFDSKFRPQNAVQIFKHTPHDAYSQLINNNGFEYMVDAAKLMSHKFFGGRPDLSIREVADIQLKAFLRLQEELTQNIRFLEQYSPSVGTELNAHMFGDGLLNEVSIDDYRLALDRVVQQLEQNSDADETKLSAMNQYREKLKLGPKTLNNITPPNVVQKLWNKISQDEEIKNADVTLEDFFGINKTNAIYPYRSSYESEIVQAVYFHLNYAGYYPDEKVYEESGYNSSFSDMQHVSNASFCQYFLSRDKRMVMKARAAYEYVGIGTEVVLLK